MKTNYLQRNSRRGPSRKIFAAVAIFIAAAGLFYTFRGAVSSAAAPLWSADNAFGRGASEFFGLFRSKDALVSENQSLSLKLSNDEDLILSLRAIASSRDELVAAFGREAPGGLPATVLVRPPETPYDSLTIDAGSDDGVSVGSPVSLPSGILIGSVAAVASRTATVLLYSAPGAKTEAVLERGELPVEINGRGGGNFAFSMPRDAAVQAGDRILSPNLSASLIAVVGEVTAAPTDAEQTVVAASPLNLGTLRYVLIGR